MHYETPRITLRIVTFRAEIGGKHCPGWSPYKPRFFDAVHPAEQAAVTKTASPLELRSYPTFYGGGNDKNREKLQNVVSKVSATTIGNHNM